jgi:DNA-binding MarR family transcriptional regulator
MAKNLEQAANKFLDLTSRLRRLGPGAPLPEEAQISPSLLSLVEYAAAAPGCGIQEMAKGLNLATPTVSISVRQLEDAGFVERQPDPQDGRAVRLFLTPKGQKLYQRMHEFRCQKFERLLTGLTPHERATLLTLLEKAVSAAEIKEQGDKK